MLLQYTGLKDAKGVEIYEGDILTPFRFKGAIDRRHRCVVDYYKGCFSFVPNGGLIRERGTLSKSLSYGKRADNDYEVVGNIYENPELLEAK